MDKQMSFIEFTMAARLKNYNLHRLLIITKNTLKTQNHQSFRKEMP